jgi:hypothetical protein
MKRKELYNYIKEEIVTTLSEDLYSEKPGADSGNKLPDVVSPDNKTAKDPKFLSKYTKVSEDNLDEMANIVSKITIQDPEKFALAKEIYTSGRTGALLAAVEAAGTEGTTQKELGVALGLKNDSELNSIISNLRAAGALSPKREKTVKPEKGDSEEDEIEFEDDNIEEPTSADEEPADEKSDEEEETPEEQPTVASDKDIEQTVGKTYSDLSPEEEKTYGMYRQAIINKAKTINNSKSSDDELAKAKAAIDKYKTNADLKKLFNKKGIDLMKFINGELKG